MGVMVNHHWHVTLEENLESIIKEGIVAQDEATFVGRLGQDVRKQKNCIYSFSCFSEALRFAHKTGWDGELKFVIIKFNTNSKDWKIDKHFGVSLEASEDWKTREEPVTPDKLVSYLKFIPEDLRVIHSEESPIIKVRLIKESEVIIE